MNRKIVSYGFFIVIILSCLPNYSAEQPDQSNAPFHVDLTSDDHQTAFNAMGGFFGTDRPPLPETEGINFVDERQQAHYHQDMRHNETHYHNENVTNTRNVYHTDLVDASNMTKWEMLRADVIVGFRQFIILRSASLLLDTTIDVGKFVGGAVIAGLEQLWYRYFPSKEREEQKKLQKKFMNLQTESDELKLRERKQKWFLTNIALLQELKPQTEADKRFVNTAILDQAKKYAAQIDVPLPEEVVTETAPAAA